ncbi:MAG: HD domain-containing phosphohydrolase [Acidimicrobiales bacterium]|jgi:PAS domain S-box-containing protein/putative nucleotidyltransferase with HDIG domain
MTVEPKLRPVSDEWLPSIAAIPLVELSADGKIVAVNDNYCELLGRSRQTLVGLSPLDFTHPDDIWATRQAIMARPRDDDRGRVLEKRYLGVDGRVIWVRVTSVWQADRQRILSYVADISDLVTARRRKEALIEHSADFIFVVDAEGKMSEANPALERLVGPTLGASLRAIAGERCHPDDLEALLAAFGAVEAGPGLHPSISFRVADDAGHWVHLSAIANNQLADSDVQGIVINARDVTVETERIIQTERNQQSLVDAFTRAVEFRDPYTAGHQLEVSRLARRIALRLGLPECAVREIALGASLHDLGKIAVPAEILNRPGALSSAERDIVRSHSEIGHRILAEAELPDVVTDVVRHHHERLDGSGYPDALAGGEISPAARIVAVADVLDAMSSHRPYRPALPIETALMEITSNQGRLYDPDVVAAALEEVGTASH